ncbi:protein of unknown function [Xenorhabdus nematophila AN6/1]|nr:protein of unknown function [Xenorhabdus nematophila AN6/1]
MDWGVYYYLCLRSNDRFVIASVLTSSVSQAAGAGMRLMAPS